MNAEKVKIVFVANRAWNLLHFRHPLINASFSANYDLFLLAPDDGFLEKLRLEFPFAHVRRLRFLTARRLAPLTDFLLFLELALFFQREKPAAALFFTAKPNLFGNFAARLFQIKTISTLTGLGYGFTHRKTWASALGFLYKRALKTTSHTFFHNENDLDFFKKMGWIQVEKSSVVAGSGVDLTKFQPAPKAKTEPFVFLFIGRFLKDKGLEELAAAAQLIQNQRLSIEIQLIGSLDETNPNSVSKKWLAEKIEAGLFKNLGSTDDVRPHLAAADALILPSYREGLSRSILEAMAMAKPILTTDVEGCRQTVEHGKNGFLVPPRDAFSLAEAMKKIAFLPENELFEMGRRSREKAEREFDERFVVADYLKILEKIVVQ